MSIHKPLFTTPQDAEAAFYDALARADLEAMMAVWAEDEEIVCVLPGGPRLAGYAAVREAWRRVFASGRRLSIALSNQVYLSGMLLSVHSLHEHLGFSGSEGQTAPVVVTNVYVRGALGWRLLAHHASPAPPEMPAQNAKTLH
ncbi:MAG TPA: nuclear transport factor 2 family protein [Rhodocyclaceae bacterium]|nr:nuclear transport factor 2 family protein [Rhodocyclaceae bacterium]